MEQLLDRSTDMCGSFAVVLSHIPYEVTKRSAIVSSLCSLGLEHGYALRMLIASEAPSSALALFRCQFEVVTRATWTAFAAKEEWVSDFTTPVEGLAEPVKSPSMDEMLKNITASAPPKASRELSLLKDAVWKPLHSYVHGGVRPVAETLTGYESDFLRKTVLNSNGLSAMAAMVLAGLSADTQPLMEIVRLQHEYIDCLPQRA